MKTLYIEPGSPWENGYNESWPSACFASNGKLRDELLNGEIFYTLKEAVILIERWRLHYNTVRPHSSLGYQTPAPTTICLALLDCLTLRFRPPSRATTTAGTLNLTGGPP